MYWRLFILVLVATAAFASRASAFTVQPAIVELSGKPGETLEAKILLQEEEGTARDYYVTIEKFIPTGENGQQTFLPPEETSGLPSWTYVREPVVRLAPGERRVFSIVIRLPADAPPGGHYAALFFSTEPPRSAGQGNVVLGARTGVLLLVAVEGNAAPNLSIKQFDATVTDHRVAFQALIENAGTLHTTPRADIRVRNLFGSTIALLDANREDGRILPGSRRLLRATWEPGFFLGPHTAELTVTHKGSARPLISRASFTVWPWRELLIVIGLLVGLFLLAHLYRRWIIRRATRKL